MCEEMNVDNTLNKPENHETAKTVAFEGNDTIDLPDFKVSTEFEKRIMSFRYGDGNARITFVELLNEQSTPMNFVEFDQVVFIKIYFEASFVGQVSCNYYIADSKKNFILGADPELVGTPLISVVNGGRYSVTYKTRLPLQEGNYSIRLEITTPQIHDVFASFLDVIDDAVVFNVAKRSGNRLWAKVFVENELTIKSY
jgi:lipopolysaccharide transport system ATP-binding protein